MNNILFLTAGLGQSGLFLDRTRVSLWRYTDHYYGEFHTKVMTYVHVHPDARAFVSFPGQAPCDTQTGYVSVFKFTRSIINTLSLGLA